MEREEEVDPAQALEALVELAVDVLGGEIDAAAAIRLADEADLRGDHDAGGVAALDPSPHCLLALAAAVGVSGVDDVDPEGYRLVEAEHALLRGEPRAPGCRRCADPSDGSGAEHELADLDARRAELNLAHQSMLLSRAAVPTRMLSVRGSLGRAVHNGKCIPAN